MARNFRKLALSLGPDLNFPRGYYHVRHAGRDYAVRVGHHLVPCTGEAHSNPHIDYCGVCMPLWGVVPVPLSCGTLDDCRRLRECAHLSIGARVRSRRGGDGGIVRSIDVNVGMVRVCWDAGDTSVTAAYDLEVAP